MAGIPRIAPADLANVMRGRVVLDPYRVLDRSAALAARLSDSPGAPRRVLTC